MMVSGSLLSLTWHYLDGVAADGFDQDGGEAVSITT